MTTTPTTKTPPQWKNGAGKRCSCPNRPRCECTWWIRVQYRGDIASGFGPVTRFAFLLEPHQQLPQTRAEAEALAARLLDWLVRGKPMSQPKTETALPAVTLTGNDLFDRWQTAMPFDPKGRKHTVVLNWESKLRRARAAFGDVPLPEFTALTIRAWVDKECQEHALATPNRILSTIVRPAVLWAQAQTPPLIAGAPFGKYGYKIDLKKEHKRLGRIAPPLEAELLDVCELLNTKEREFAGGLLADYLTLAIDTGGRGEYFDLRNGDVDWQAHKLTLRQTKNGEARFVPFNPTGRVAALLMRRRFSGPKAPVLARPDGSPVAKLWKTWVEVICILRRIPYICTRKGLDKATSAAYKAEQLVPYLARHEAATWWGLKGVSDASAKFLQGHLSQYDTHGRYKHEQYAIARAELAEKVWPCERERAQPEQATPSPRRRRR